MFAIFLLLLSINVRKHAPNLTVALKVFIYVMFLNIRSKFLVQISFSLMLVENDSNRIVAKMFLTYTIITEKSLIKQKTIVS